MPLFNCGCNVVTLKEEEGQYAVSACIGKQRAFNLYKDQQTAWEMFATWMKAASQEYLESFDNFKKE